MKPSVVSYYAAGYYNAGLYIQYRITLERIICDGSCRYSVSYFSGTKTPLYGGG